MRHPTMDTLSKIMRHTSKAGDCRVWKGPYHVSGLPLVYAPHLYAERLAKGNKRRGNSMCSTRRRVWELSTGERLAKGDRVYMTRCTTPGCILKGHMDRLSIAEMMGRVADSGVYRTTRKHLSAVANARSKAKVTMELAQSIRERVKKRGDAVRVAKAEGLSATLVRQIARGERWRTTTLPGSSVFNPI